MNTAIRRFPAVISRRFSAAAAKSGTFKAKTSREVWLGDTGAYPVIGTILLGLAFMSSATVWSSFANPDARWTNSTRKSLFRGEMAREYQHPVNPNVNH
jgi:hypothetical protein